MSGPLHRGHRSCFGHVVAPHAPHRAPISCAFSCGQVETSGASTFIMNRPPSSEWHRFDPTVSADCRTNRVVGGCPMHAGSIDSVLYPYVISDGILVGTAAN